MNQTGKKCRKVWFIVAGHNKFLGRVWLINFLFSKPEYNSSSSATSTLVESCPQNIKERNEAAASKGCERLTHPCFSF